MNCIVKVGFIGIVFCLLFSRNFAQPRYSSKELKMELDESYCTNSLNVVCKCLVVNTSIFDVDDDDTTTIRIDGPFLICIKGTNKIESKEGIYTSNVFDKNGKPYKIWEQEYHKDRLNGKWKVFNLRGTMISFQTFKDDSLNGISQEIGIDGETVLSETYYKNSSFHYSRKQFYPNGKLSEKFEVVNGFITGEARWYYETGVLMER